MDCEIPMWLFGDDWHRRASSRGRVRAGTPRQRERMKRNMKRVAAVALLLCAMLAPAAVHADPARLGKAYDMDVGDVVALRITGLLTLRPEMAEAPVFAAWDHDRKVLELTVAGSQSEVEKAKGALEKLGRILDDKVLPQVNKALGVNLVNGDLTLIYVNRKAAKEVVRREGGKYLVQ